MYILIPFIKIRKHRITQKEMNSSTAIHKSRSVRRRPACLACRRRKVRCGRSEDTGICNRCTEMNIKCITPPTFRSSVMERYVTSDLQLSLLTLLTDAIFPRIMNMPISYLRNCKNAKGRTTL